MDNDNLTNPTTTIHPPQPTPATLKIQSDDTDTGFIIINESDFDKSTMKKYVEKKAAPAPDAPAAT